jgi:hydrogenase-4 membrane subunit HyfE
MMVAQWPLQAPGRYQLQLAYAMPPDYLRRGLCWGKAITATVTFTIGQSRTTPWLLIAVIAVVVIAVIVVFLLLRRRSPSSQRCRYQPQWLSCSR